MAFYPVNQSLVTWSHKVAKQVGKYSLYFGHLGVQLCTEVLPLQKKGEQKWLFLSRVPFYTASITLTPKPTGTQRIKYMPKVL